MNVALIGPKLDLAYEYKHLGDSTDIISQVDPVHKLEPTFAVKI